MKAYGIYLDNAIRRFSTVFPLEAVGGIENHTFCNGVERGKLELCIRLSGTEISMRESYNGVEQELRYPNVLIKLPHVERKYVLDHLRDVIYFRYPTDLLEPMTKAGLISKPYAWHFEMRPDIGRVLREVRELLQHTNGHGIADRLDLLGMTLWELLLMERDRKFDEGMDNAEIRIRQVAAYLQIHFADQINFGEIAKLNGFSERNFFRCWKRYFTMSPFEYVQQLKFAESERLLADTNLSVITIAKKLGFHNPGYFCEIFRKNHGITPLKFRSRHNNHKR